MSVVKFDLSARPINPLRRESSRETSATKVVNFSDFRQISSSSKQDISENLDLLIVKKNKHMYGANIPFYCLCFNRPNQQGLKANCLEIPAARFLSAIQRIMKVYVTESDGDQMDFSAWRLHKGAEFFKALLSDLIFISRDEIPELIAVKNHPHWIR